MNAFSSLSTRQRLGFYLWLFMTVAILLGFAHTLWRGIHINTNLLDLLPQSKQQANGAQASQRLNNMLGKQVVFLIGAATQQQAINAADCFYRAIHKTQKAPTDPLPVFSQITYLIDAQQQQAWASFYFPHRLSLLTPEQQTWLKTNNVQAIEQTSLAKLYSPMSIGSASFINDPFLLFSSYLLSLPNPAPRMTLIHNHLMRFYHHTWYVLLTATLNDNSFSTTNQQQAIAFIKSAEQQVLASYPHTQWLMSGLLFYAKAGTDEARHNIATIGIGSIVGIILLMLWVFRSLSPLLYTLLSSTLGFIAAVVVVQAIFGSLYLFTLVFGASLIGISVDYAFFFYADRLFGGSSWHASHGLTRIIRGISLGLLNILLAYILLAFIPFAGLKQLAIFAIAGLIMAYATVVGLFPLLLTATTAPHAPVMKRRLEHCLNRYRSLSTLKIIVIYLGIAAITLVGSVRLIANDDIHILASASPQLKQQEQTIQRIVGTSMGQSYYLVTGRTPDEVLMHESALTQQLDQLFPTLQPRYISISSYLPTQATQQENRQLIQSKLIKTALLPYLQGLGMSAANAKKLQQQLLQLPVNPLTVDTWLQSPVSAHLRYLWLGKIGTNDASIMMLSKYLPNTTLRMLAAKMPDVTYLNQADSLSALFKHYRHRISIVLIIAYLLLLAWFMRRYGCRRGVLLWLPPVSAILFTLSLLGIIGVPFTLFSIVALVLVFGIAVDYVIFFAETKADYASTLLAVSLSAITTLLSFGLLALSSTSAVHYFGLTVTLGILSGWLLAPLAMLTVPTTPREKDTPHPVCTHGPYYPYSEEKGVKQIRPCSRLVLWCSTLLLCGCAHLTPTPTPMPPTTPTIQMAGQTLTLPSPAALNLHQTATQLLSAQYKQQHYTTQVQVETSPQRIILVALSGWGGQVFSINYDGHSIHSNSLPMKNGAIGIHQVLSDFVITYAPATVINHMFAGTPLQLKTTPNQRQVIAHGQPILVINYQYPNPWQGQVTLNNLALHYTMTITTVAATQGGHDESLS